MMYTLLLGHPKTRFPGSMFGGRGYWLRVTRSGTASSSIKKRIMFHRLKHQLWIIVDSRQTTLARHLPTSGSDWQMFS